MSVGRRRLLRRAARWAYDRRSERSRHQLGKEWRATRDGDHLRVLLAALLRPDSNCIDVGANRGDVLREILRCAPEGRHIAYEPLPALAAALAREHPDVDVRARALSTGTGEKTFVHCLTDPAYSGFHEREYPSADARVERLTVPTERLDDALPAGYEPDLIKVDVEGAELEVFQGALGTLERCRPIVCFEHDVDTAALYGTSSGDVFGVLSGAGLRIFDMEGAGPLSPEAFAEAARGLMINFFARP